jgi:hypothetical protein
VVPEDKATPWQKMELVHLELSTTNQKVGLKAVKGEKHATVDFFDILEQYDKQDAALAAYSKVRTPISIRTTRTMSFFWDARPVRWCGGKRGRCLPEGWER